jgi:hypothetical protein
MGNVMDEAQQVSQLIGDIYEKSSEVKVGGSQPSARRPTRRCMMYSPRLMPETTKSD